MREIPLLLNGPMVHAVLEGRKTVTRRLVTDLRGFGRITEFGASDTHGYDWHFRDRGMRWNDISHERLLAGCPYGKPGDCLWVRESLGYDAEWGHYYKAPGRHAQVTYLCELFDDPEAETGPSYDASLPDRGVPSIHLPRRYSRITLEVTGVRVERRQDGKGEMDRESRYIAEGINRIHHGDGAHYYSAIRNEPHPKNWNDPFYAWRELWKATGGDWDANPWVWVVEFKRIEQERKAA